MFIRKLHKILLLTALLCFSNFLIAEIIIVEQDSWDGTSMSYDLEICNEQDFEGFLYTGNIQKVKLWKDGVLVGQNGLHVLPQNRSYPRDYAYIHLNLKAGETQSYRLEFFSLLDFSHFSLEKNIESNISIKAWDVFPRMLFSIGTLLVLLLFFFFSIGRYWQLREKSFLYYGGYLISFFLVLLSLLEQSPFINVFFSYNTDLMVNGKILFSIMPALFYIQFHRSFLDLKTVYPRVDRHGKLIFLILVSSLILFYIAFFIIENKVFIESLKSAVKILIGLLATVFMIDIYTKVRTRLTAYVVVGAFFLIIGGLSIFYTNLTIDATSLEFWSNGMMIMQVSVLLEILVFSLGLGCKLKEKQQAIISSQLMIIEQMVEKHELELKLQETIEIQEGLEIQHNDLLSSLLDTNSVQQQSIFIEKVNSILKTHLEEENFGVEQLSISLGLSRTHLHRKIKSLINQTPSEYIKKFRLQVALQLLQNSDFNISEIAYRVGFRDPSYFSKVFYKSFGVKPSAIKSTLLAD